MVTESDKSSAMYDLIPMNLYNQMSPYEAFAISYLLLFMFLLSCSLAMLLASIYGKKTLTFWVVMISIAVGIVFCEVKVDVGFPCKSFHIMDTFPELL